VIRPVPNVHREPITDKGGMWGQKRFRNVYRLQGPAIIDEPAPAAAT